MTKDEREELLACASEIVHLHGLYAGLNTMISNERKDLLCEETAQKVYALIDGAINNEFSRIESAMEAFV